MSDLTIRPATPADGAALAAIYAPYVLETAFSFEETPPDAHEMAARIASVSSQHPYLVAERGGDVVGYAYGSAHRTRSAYRFAVDVSIYLAPSAHRQGIGRRLYTALFEDLSARGMHMAFAGISLPNPASVALHEALGFRPVGVYSEVGYKFGRWIDTGWWQKRL